MRRRTTFVLTLTAAVCVSHTSLADCCNDFWSCAAAVATGGLTCEVENIVDSVKKLAQTVDNLKNDLSSKAYDVVNDASNAVNQSASEANQIATQAAAQVTNAAARGHVIANPSPYNRAVAGPSVATLAGSNGGSGGPTPVNVASGSGGSGGFNGGSGSGGQGSSASGGSGSSGPGGVAGRAVAAPPVVFGRAADPGAVKTALSRGDSYLQGLSAAQPGYQREVSNAASGAVSCLSPHIANAQQMITQAAIEPLQLLANSLADLLAHPEHIFDPAAQIDADIQNIQNSVDALFDKMTAEITTEANGRLEAVHGTLDLMQDEAQVAGSVADAMQKVANSGAQADLDALNRLLPGPAANASRVVRGTTLPAGISAPKSAVSALAHAQPQNIRATLLHKSEVSDIASRWNGIKVQKGAQPTANPSYALRVDPEFARLRGKPPLEVQRQKELWIQEARRRYANEPKTLEKVIGYIESRARP